MRCCLDYGDDDYDLLGGHLVAGISGLPRRQCPTLGRHALDLTAQLNLLLEQGIARPAILGLSHCRLTA